MTTREEIVAVARSTLDTLWKHQGRLPKFGIDCIGVILFTARQLGISDFEPPPYDRDARWHEFIPYFRQHMAEIPIGEAGPGDALTFRQHIYPCHCGILTEGGSDPKFLHAFALRRKVVEERYTPPWRRITVAAFRYPGLEG